MTEVHHWIWVDGFGSGGLSTDGRQDARTEGVKGDAWFLHFTPEAGKMDVPSKKVTIMRVSIK